MNNSLLIVYSNLGLGGIPTKIVDIVNEMKTSHPKTTIYILLKKRAHFNLRSQITNPNVVIKDSAINNSIFFIVRVWLFMFIHHPRTILTFISAYALPVLATRHLFFWKKSDIIVSEDHYTSTVVQQMKFPVLQRQGIRLLYPLATKIIVPTIAVSRDLQQSFHIPANKIAVGQNWSRYADRANIETRPIFDVAYIGRIDKTKHVLSLIKLLERYIHTTNKHLSCVLVGEGSEFNTCKTYINRHNLGHNIYLFPPVLDVSDYLRESKIYINNSEEKTEGFPVAILDAMSCGAIVVTKYFLGVQEILNKTNAYIVKTDDEILRSISHILHQYKAQLSVIRAAKQHVSHYNSLNNVRAYTQLF